MAALNFAGGIYKQDYIAGVTGSNPFGSTSSNLTCKTNTAFVLTDGFATDVRKRTGLITLVVIILTWEASRERSLCNQRSQLSKASARPQKP
jgi:hypothetical protein